MNFLRDFRRNIDTRIVVSSAVGVALFGTAVYVAGKTGFGPLKSAAKIANGGK